MSEREPFSDDSLDALLSEARWPEPSSDAIARLTRVRQQSILQPLAIAASVLLVFGIFAWNVMQTSRPHVVSQVIPAMQVRAIGRAPTKLELGMVKVIEKEKCPPVGSGEISRTAASPIKAVASAKPPAVDRMQIARRYCEAVVHREAGVFDAIDREKSPPVDELIQLLNDNRVDIRIAAAKILGHIDGAETTRKLVELAEKNQNRREAMIALVASNGAEAKAFVQDAAKSGPLVSVTRSIMTEHLQ